jgi:hypothetical protein
MRLNRANSTLRSEPNFRTANNGLIRRAIIWGDDRTTLSLDQIIALWESKPRKTPLAVMLAKMLNESSRKPYISRYEVGQHLDNPSWKWKNEFDSTSYGLFQFMGFHLTGKYKVADQNNVYASFTIEKQFDLFDEFMGKHLAKAQELFPKKSFDEQVWHAIAGYGGDYTPSGSGVTLTDRNFQTYLQYKDYKKKESG